MNKLTYESYLEAYFGEKNILTYQSWLHREYLKIINNLERKLDIYHSECCLLKQEIKDLELKNQIISTGWEE